MFNPLKNIQLGELFIMLLSKHIVQWQVTMFSYALHFGLNSFFFVTKLQDLMTIVLTKRYMESFGSGIARN